MNLAIVLIIRLETFVIYIKFVKCAGADFADLPQFYNI